MSLAHPCPSKIVCPPGDGFLGVDFPFANLSSELPDRDDFIDDFYGFYWLWPDLGSNWERNSCLGICRSLISQADADTCAAIQNLICLLDTWGVCPTCTGDGNGTSGPPIIARRNLPAQIFYNQMATCTAHCPDGLPFTYQVPAGMFAMPSQAMADRVAGSFACQLAQSLKLCLSTLVRQACVGQEYGADIRTNRAEPTTFTIVSGSLPPGITTSQPATNRFSFDGTPTTPGNYSFAVRAQVSDGRFMQKGYVINVMGASPDTLPDGEENAFYHVQLSASGNVGTVSWSVESGAFPNGISMDGTGFISGTPHETGDFTVEINFRDTDNNSCLKTYALHVGPGTCVDWDGVAWAAGLISGPGVTLASFVGGDVNIQIDCVGAGTTAIRNQVGTVLYTGPGCNCQAVITIDRTVATESAASGFRIFQDAALLVDFKTSDMIPLAGSVTIPFAVVAGVNSVITIRGNVILPDSYYSLVTGSAGRHSYRHLQISNI